MTNLSNEEKIAKIELLINEGNGLLVTKSYEQPDISYYVYEEREPNIVTYTDVDSKAYPAWRIKSLALLKTLLGENNTYIKEFEENCKAESTERNLNQGLGVLVAVKSGYQDGTITEEINFKEGLQVTYPNKYWHCAIKLISKNEYSVVNDLSFDELKTKIIEPWTSFKPFAIAGKIVNKKESLEEIKITNTPKQQKYYADLHNKQMREANIVDGATDRKMLPLEEGTDYTQELLFSAISNKVAQLDDPSSAIVERVCERIARTANLLSNRTREGKASFKVEDEYDVQDLLQATLRAFVKHSVQENPLPKIAGSSSRIDITIEDIGLLIEVKYVRSPNEQKKLVEDFSKDIVLYSQWEHLKLFLYLVYNSDDLRDPEGLEGLNGEKNINGRKFYTKVILG